MKSFTVIYNIKIYIFYDATYVVKYRSSNITEIIFLERSTIQYNIQGV